MSVRRSVGLELLLVVDGSRGRVDADALLRCSNSNSARLVVVAVVALVRLWEMKSQSQKVVRFISNFVFGFRSHRQHIAKKGREGGDSGERKRTAQIEMKLISLARAQTNERTNEMNAPKPGFATA